MLILSQDGCNIVTLENGTIQSIRGNIVFIGNGANCELGNYNAHPGVNTDFSIALKVVEQIFNAKIKGIAYYKMPKINEVK